MGEQDIQSVIDSVPELSLWLLVAGLVTGLMLWLLGRRLFRPMCALSGLLLGGISSFIIAREMSATQTTQLAVSVAGAVAGCVAAWLMFRLWMGLAGAIILAAAATLSLVVVDGIPLPAVSLEDVRIERTEADGEPDDDDTGRPGITINAPVDTLGVWWDERAGGERTGLIFAGCIGAVVGVVAGLLWPYAAASWQTALIGATLLFITGIRLAERVAGESAIPLPTAPAGQLAIVGLITLVGVLLQWTIFRKPADK